jgi:hypothetical protein
MELIDNKSKLLGDDLQKEITHGTKLKMVASYFSIYAFEALKEELSSIEDLEFIFPSPTFVNKGIKDNIKKEKREYYIPQRMMEHSLYGTEFEIRLRNQLTQKVIARECAEWIKDKVKFKSNITESELQNFIYLENDDKKVTYTPIKGFTSVDLGYEKRQVVSGIAKFYTPDQLVGKKVCLVTNLKPVKLCGVDSYGMILASGEEDVKVVFLDPSAKNGDRIH